MSSPELDELENCGDLASLEAALRRICSRYGVVRHLTILPVNHVGQPQAMCLVRMMSADQEHHIMTALGIGRFGGEMVLVVNLHRAALQPTDAAAAAARAH